MRRFGLMIVAMLLSVVAFAQKQYDADFTQTRVMKITGKTTEMTGHLNFDGVDHLTMDYTDPFGEFFYISGNTVSLNLNGKQTILDASKVKMVALQRSTLLNCISGNWEQAAIDNNAETTVTEKDGLRHVVITVKGKVPRGGYSSVELTYRMKDNALVKMVLEEAIGIINTYEMR
jgi:hypothetical protein